jgi:hypothetical protein
LFSNRVVRDVAIVFSNFMDVIVRTEPKPFGHRDRGLAGGAQILTRDNGFSPSSQSPCLIRATQMLIDAMTNNVKKDHLPSGRQWRSCMEWR